MTRSLRIPRATRVATPLATPLARALATAAAGAVLATVAVLATPANAAATDDHAPVLRSSLVGSSPTGPALASVTPGTAPWVVDKGKVRVGADGSLDVVVRGLVIPTAPANGTNPVPSLSASLVCNGAVVASTAAVPFSTAGNARIDAHVTVASPCLSPAVLLHPNTNTRVYIAANGG